MKKTLNILFAVMTCAMAFVAGTAHAQSLLVSGSAGVTTGNGPLDQTSSDSSSISSVTTAGAVADFWPGNETYTSGSGDASYSALADFGRLGVKSEASASQGSGANPFGTQATAYGQASFSDFIQVSGGEAGDLVTLSYSIPVHGIFEGNEGPGSSITYWMAIDYILGGVSGSAGWCSSNVGGISACNNPIGNGDALTGTFTAVVGTGFSVVNQMEVLASATGGGLYSDGETLDSFVGSSAAISGAFDHTVLTYITPLDPSISLIAASGHDYSLPSTVPAPVPEPDTYALLMGGLAFLVLSHIVAQDAIAT